MSDEDTQPILPTTDAIIGPAVAALVEVRPSTYPFIGPSLTGAYGNVFRGLRGQAKVALARLSDLVRNGFLDLATGQPLIDLCASEFDAIQDDTSEPAFGYVLYTRTSGPSGTIPKGTQWTRPAQSSSLADRKVALGAATYESSQEVFVAKDQRTVVIPIVAQQAGSASNTPIVDSNSGLFPAGNLKLSSALFDPSFTQTEYSVGGGSDGASDADRRRYAKSYVVGKFGPTVDSIIAGVYQDGRVHKAIFADDPARGTLNVYIADQSWASSPQWAKQVQQSLYDDNWVGTGCRVVVGHVRNFLVSVSCTVALRDAVYLSSTSDIVPVIQATIRSYFDDREDWNIWTTAGLTAAISACDRRVMKCTSASIILPNGSTVADSSSTNPIATYRSSDGPSFNPEPSTSHLYLIDNGVSVSFTPPP